MPEAVELFASDQPIVEPGYYVLRLVSHNANVMTYVVPEGPGQYRLPHWHQYMRREDRVLARIYPERIPDNAQGANDGQVHS